MTSTQSLYKFQKLDHTSWSFIRGVEILAGIFEDKEKSQQVSNVYVIPGHVFVLFRDNTLLLSFDASIEDFRHTSLQKQQEIHRMLTSKNPQQGIRKNFPIINALQEIFENSDNPMILVPNSAQPFVKLLFIREAQLILLAVTQHGDILIWEWSDTEYVWKWINKISFMSGFDTKRVVRDVIYLAKYNRILWSSESRIYITEFFFDTIEQKKKRMLAPRVGVSKELTTFDLKKMYWGFDGLWMLQSQKIGYLNFRTSGMQQLEIKQNNKKNVLGTIVGSCQHDLSEELVLLDTQGALFVCKPEQNSIQAVHLCTLEPNPFGDLVVTDLEIDFFVYHHIAGVVINKTTLKLYELKCGALLYESNMDFGVWNIALRGSLGCWGTNGIFLIETSGPIQKQGEALVKHTPKGDVPCAISFAQEYNLGHWQAKYALDILFTSKDEAIKVKAAEALLPHVQNPILVISLLSPTVSRQFIKKTVQNFLEQYHYKNTDSSQSESAIIASRNAFMLHTPLNETVVPILEKYLELLIKDEQNVIDESSFSLFIDISQYNAEQVHELSRSHMEYIMRTDPKGLLKKLEEVLLLNETLPESLFYLEESRNTNHPFFSILCKLYFSQCPEKLFPFVAKVQNQYNGSKEVNFYSQALCVLPLYTALPSPCIDVVCGLLRASSIVLKEKITDIADQPQKAVGLLLYVHKWEESLQVLQDQKSDIIRMELFHALFKYCFQEQQYKKLEELFAFVPPTMNVFDLLKMFTMYVPKDRTKILAGDHELSVKIVKERLLKLFNK